MTCFQAIPSRRIRRHRHRIWTDRRRHFGRHHRRGAGPGYQARVHFHERAERAEVIAPPAIASRCEEARSARAFLRFAKRCHASRYHFAWKARCLLQRSAMVLLRKSLVANLSRDFDQLWRDSMIPRAFNAARLVFVSVEWRAGSLKCRPSTGRKCRVAFAFRRTVRLAVCLVKAGAPLTDRCPPAVDRMAGGDSSSGTPPLDHDDPGSN